MSPACNWTFDAAFYRRSTRINQRAFSANKELIVISTSFRGIFQRQREMAFILEVCL